MNRQTRLLLGISTTVAVTLLLAWLAVQALVIRPGIGERERVRTAEVLEAAERMRQGTSKKEIEDSEGIDLRIFLGDEAGPPPGDGWIREETARGTVWKRRGGKYDIAAWTGRAWVVIHEDLPVASTLALAFIAAGLPVVALMFGLSRRSQRHQELAEATLSRMAAGNLTERLDEGAGGAEVRRMAAAVNRMAAHLEALLQADRERMAGLSHELRTPLTRIRLELELARREGGARVRLDRIERDIESFDSMLAEMLELSRLQLVGEQMMTPQTVDLAGLARCVVEEGGWPDVEVRGQGTAHVDSKLVGRLLANLVRNSVEHAPDARRWVSVEPGVVEVGDDGPGIPAGAQSRTLGAFQRGATSAGHGLGLAIVARIAQLHGGSVSLSTPPGLTVRVCFDEGTRAARPRPV